MRHLEHTLEARDASLQQAKAGYARSFLTTFIKRLKSEADSKERSARLNEVSHWIKQPAVRKALHHGGEMALPWKDQPGCVRKRFSGVHDFSIVAQIADGLKHGAYVACAVIK